MKLTLSEYYSLYDAHEKPASTLFHKYVSKKIARFITYYFLRFNITPNQMSISSFLLLLIGVILLCNTERTLGTVAFVFLSQLSYAIDCSDGVVARITKTSSSFGGFLDLFMDRISLFTLQFGLGVSIFSENSNSNLLKLYIVSCFLYFIYTVVAMMKGFCFPQKKGVMKNNIMERSIVTNIVKFLYEFIDTGIMMFLIGIAYFFNLAFYAIIVYGLLGLVLTIGVFYYLINDAEI
jgi:phosphatidylglycerophosphate synthase